MIKKHLGFALNIAALALFIPGIVLPMFSMSMEMTAQVSASTLSSDLLNKELSLLATIEELWQDQRLLVAALIFLFSICIPLIKTALASLAYFTKNTAVEAKILNFVAGIGKWSMADVFVVAVFLAILSTNHAETANNQQFSILGFKVDLLISSETFSAAGMGFYYFTGYCLLSLLGTHFSHSSLK
ncbi:paraquat-inducible protein A [Thalassomonas haliotis]|uniref:Paraquat-inducible protein A n=1 Tax=Thalassomonas haliotis TaxID=485448 RepID=A0ABY7VIE1_9GAMM|nr:paraquat-inducible protein A [Thalassomonas haliotis]WDE13132.1 paraquat-inducible protein A [Thalassomonas haliotis]